jgi:MATE family multidrug resistance protein
VLLLAYPVVLSSLANTLMGVTDTLFMGWVSTAAQGGVGLGGVLAWTCASLFVGTLTAINTFVAQHFGAGQLARCGPVVWRGLLVALGFSLLVLPLARPISRLVLVFGAPQAVAEVASGYAFIRILGLPVMMADACVTSFLRGIGNTRTPMKISLFTVFLNVPVNYWLVFGGLGVPALGPKGAACGTVISQAAGLLLLLHVFLRAPTRHRFSTGLPHRWAMRDLHALLRVGLPIGVSWSLEMVTWTLFAAIVSGMGKEPLAAHNIVIQVLHVSFMPGLALSVAATTLVGQHIGAGDPAGAARSGFAAVKLGMAFMGLMGLVFLLLGGAIASGFNRDPLVIGHARTLFMLAAAFQLFDAIGMVSGGILRGAGDTRWPMFILVGCAWLIFLPLVWLFGRRLGWGVAGSWLGATIYIIVLGMAMLARVLSGRWQRYSVRGPEEEAPGTAALPAARG